MGRVGPVVQRVLGVGQAGEQLTHHRVPQTVTDHPGVHGPHTPWSVFPQPGPVGASDTPTQGVVLPVTGEMHRRPPLPDISDWFDSFGPMVGWRTMRGQLQGIRIEDYPDGDDYVVRAELPGVDPGRDVDLSVQRGVLTIRAERREEQHDKNHSEFHYGSSTRSIPLPDGAQEGDVSADYKDGVLTIRVPCAQPPAQAHKINVTRTE